MRRQCGVERKYISHITKIFSFTWFGSSPTHYSRLEKSYDLAGSWFSLCWLYHIEWVSASIGVAHASKCGKGARFVLCIMSGHAHSHWMAYSQSKNATIEEIWGSFGQNRSQKWTNWKIQWTFRSLNIRHCRCVRISCRIVLRSISLMHFVKCMCPFAPTATGNHANYETEKRISGRLARTHCQFGWWWPTWRLPRYNWCNNMQVNKRNSFEVRAPLEWRWPNEANARSVGVAVCEAWTKWCVNSSAENLTQMVRKRRERTRSPSKIE